MEVYGFIRSAVDDRGSSCRNTPRSRQDGITFSMPMTVIRVCGRVRHIRPLPSDSTTDSVPVSAMAKLAPLMPTRGGQEDLPQVQPGGLGQRGRVVGQRRVDVGHLAQEDLPDLRPVAVDGGHQEVRGPVVAELHDELGQVGLVRGDARVGERVVEPDLVGDHGLDLDGRLRAGGLDQPVTIWFASAASLAQCTVPPRA